MSIVTITASGIVREGVDAGRTARIAAQLMEQGFERTVWVDYLTKRLPNNRGHVFVTIRKNNLHCLAELTDADHNFTASNPDRLKLRLAKILGE